MHAWRQRRASEWADRNYRFGVLNGWLVFIGDGFLNASVVLAGFASRLGASNAVIGLLPAIQAGGWMLPQILVAARIRQHPYKLPVYRSAATIRVISYLWMIASSALLIDYPGVLLTSFILGMVINALASGVSGLPFLEVVSKTIPSERRTAFFGVRNLVGGILAFLAGLAVREILASPIPFPYNYTVIFTLATVAFTLGYGVFGRIQEPPDPPQPPSNLRAELRAIPLTLREDRDFRAFLSVRLLLAFASLSEPFYAVFALRELGMPTSMLGVFLMVLAGTAPLSNIVWTRLAQGHGSRRIIRASAACALLAPLLALTLSSWWPGAYLLVFVATSVAAQGFNLGHTNHLLNLAPPHARGRYIGTLNTIVGVALFAPVLGGLLADTLGYRAVFAVSITLYALAWWWSNRLRRDA
ncbi:MFS transporter [Deinococcus peraridilitoris]|uniref:Major Facilitator Superfamily transporter n=1 Tax=Deinococcus peraridilitoris (strain DSM 19664 / LMG 22246 / CIP 109416 / KR-200) TaxID=937777 RepID=L0A5A6_DEIPD|nr:MFS transporter [Deinococcus peraridilitoris]AFZ69068.1 Major Facilitator Superfamily transporter [Deinococcus peraridilitoris DSM 19664]